ncbi:hypothetical protein ACS0TY_000731 [Phlomoides rotata]
MSSLELYFSTAQDDDDENLHRKASKSCSYVKTQTSRKLDMEMDIEKQNSKLYKENCEMMRANEMLRQKAERLKQENQALRSELKQKLLEATTKEKLNLQLKINTTSSSGHKKSNKCRCQIHN